MHFIFVCFISIVSNQPWTMQPWARFNYMCRLVVDWLMTPTLSSTRLCPFSTVSLLLLCYAEFGICVSFIYCHTHTQQTKTHVNSRYELEPFYEFFYNPRTSWCIHPFLLRQTMRANLGAALREDAAGGSAAGLSKLEAAVASYSEKLLEDSQTSVKDKLMTLCPVVTNFLGSEAVNPLKAGNPLSVTSHSAFGKLKAMILSSCTCCANGMVDGDDMHMCMFHSPEIQLSDVLYEITKNVHSIFDDKFICFANLYLTQTVSGRVFCSFVHLSLIEIKPTMSNRLGVWTRTFLSLHLIGLYCIPYQNQRANVSILTWPPSNWTIGHRTFNNFLFIILMFEFRSTTKHDPTEPNIDSLHYHAYDEEVFPFLRCLFMQLVWHLTLKPWSLYTNSTITGINHWLSTCLFWGCSWTDIIFFELSKSSILNCRLTPESWTNNWWTNIGRLGDTWCSCWDSQT